MTRLSTYFDELAIDKNSQEFINFNRERWRGSRAASATSEVLVELYPVSQTILAFSYFANLLAKFHDSKLVSFSISTRNSFLYTKRYRKTWEIYKSFNVVKHVNTKLVDKEKGAHLAEVVLSGLRSKEDVLDLVHDGCPIGNDIYESYLMTYRRPTVDILSDEFRNHLVECLSLYFYWNTYLESHNVKAIIVSHGIYKFGIIVKIAMKMGIPVYLPNIKAMYCLKNFGELGNPDFVSYRSQFENLPEPVRTEGIAWAKQQLQRRLSGEVGVNMAYSAKSAFDRSGFGGRALRRSDRIKVLIATHCFFDNPNAYGRNLFPDFYEWLSFLGEISNKTEYDWYIKTHPDVLPGNDEIIGEILRKYPKISRVPSSVSHLQLVEEGISVVLTVYGSVGHEYPLLGKPVITAGANPHIAYEFNVHPKSIEEYSDRLLNLANIKTDFDESEVYEFYFVHHGYNICQHLFLNSYFDFVSKLPTNEQNSGRAYSYFLEEHSADKDSSICNKISSFIISGDYKYYENEYFRDITT